MTKINIYVEGPADKAFLEAIFEKHFPDEEPSIFALEGNHTRLPEKAQRLKEGKLNLIILDSDVNNDQLVADTLKPIEDEEKQAGRKLLYKCFFIQKNLEDLVSQISPEGKKDLWECIDLYTKCNSGLKSDDLRPIDNKAKVYIYVNSHKVPTHLKSKPFQNPEIWNLNHEALQPFINFLKPHFS